MAYSTSASVAAAIEYECQTENSPNTADPMRREVLHAVKGWYQYDWLAIENKLRTSFLVHFRHLGGGWERKGY